METQCGAVKTLFDLTDRVALVTGGSRGIGKEIAEGFAEAGASVFILARREQWLEPAVAELRGCGFRCDGMICDVADHLQASAAVDRCIQTFGKIDVLVNNAGITWGAPAEDMPLDKWHSVIETNLTGAFLFAQFAGRHMIARSYGRIINVSSVNAVQGGISPDIPTCGYVASKGGLIALTRELAVKWGPHGIRVNCIAPGLFETRMTALIWDNAEQAVRHAAALRRAGLPGELKGVAVFLAADASNYITGQTIIVDGGMTLA